MTNHNRFKSIYMYEVVSVVVCIVIGISILYAAAIKIFPNKVSDDNFVEEMIEDQLHDKTGIEIDFTPDTKEDVKVS